MRFFDRLVSTLLAATFFLPMLPGQASPGVTGEVSRHKTPAAAEVAQSGYGVPVISGVDLQNGTSTFRPGDTVNVVLNGTSGGTAAFDITGVRNGIPMREVARGRYTGSMAVQHGMQVTNARLIGHLTVQGSSVSLVANGALTIGTPYVAPAYGPGPSYQQYPTDTYPIERYPTSQQYPYPQYPYSQHPTYPQQYPYQQPSATYAPGPIFVNVSSPVAGQPVGNDFTVAGNTVPYARLIITASQPGAPILGFIKIGKQVARTGGVADANGYFAIPVHLNSRNGRNNINLKVVATDRQTSASRQVEFNIATGGF